MKSKLLLAWLLLSSVFLCGQGLRYDSVANTTSTIAGVSVTTPLPGATVTVCSIPQIVASGGASESGNVVTITTTAPHGLSAGQSVIIQDVGVAGYNGTFTIATAPGGAGSTTFTYINGTTGLGNSGGGFAVPNTKPCTNTATIYSDPGLAIPLANPMTADAQGNFGFWGNSGTYAYTISGSGITGAGPFYITLAISLNANNSFTCTNVKGLFGAVGNGVTDDTAAIQAALNFAGVSGSGTQHTCLFFPAGNYKITSTLVYEGTNGLGVTIIGEAGRVNDAPHGSAIQWFGPNMGTMLLMLSGNNSQIENLDFDVSPAGGGQAQVGVWWDASNTVTQVVYNISAISRSGNVVTATTSAAHAVTPGRIVKIAGSTGGTTSFNGTFHVLYANDNTHISWIQTGANESGNAAGTVTNYRSATSNGGIMRSVTVIRPKAISSTIASITGTNPITVTTSTPHFLTLDDMAIVRSTSDSTYNAVWRVATIPTSTTATMQLVTATLANNPDGLGSSGGTVLAGGLGVRISHKDSLTPQVSAMSFYDVQVIGDGLGNSVAAFKVDGGGNAKDFNFYNLFVSATRYGLVDFLSGATAVYGYQSSLQTPDSSPLFASIEFLNMGENVTISGLETEATGGNNRLLASTAQGSQIHFDASEWASAAPTDDVVIAFWGALTLTSSKLMNLRTASSVPWMIPSVLSFNGTSSASLVSVSSAYSSTAAGGASPNAGWIPVKDINGNLFMGPGSFYNNRAVNVTSISDNSADPSTGLLTPLNGFMPTQVIASTSTGGNVGIAASGFIRMASTDLACWRNNAGTPNTADICAAKDTSDRLTFNAQIVSDGAHANTLTIGTGTGTTAGTAIGAGTSQTLAITVSGALTTDVAQCSTNAAYPATWLTGITVLPPVVTANTVTLTLTNPSAGSITPVAQTFRCTVTR